MFIAYAPMPDRQMHVCVLGSMNISPLTGRNQNSICKCRSGNRVLFDLFAHYVVSSAWSCG